MTPNVEVFHAYKRRRGCRLGYFTGQHIGVTEESRNKCVNGMFVDDFGGSDL